ncbi:hypothetical protein [Chitinivorax sp. B]|uniref:hypothetical protein n=1 Tax=Chitinivorax sp. B TaxID=2502235 RepID=UPI0010F81DCD|nr:hypothetical protein [Chitinivorax sp. B]
MTAHDGMTAALLQQAGALDAEAEALMQPAMATPDANHDESDIRGLLELAGAMLTPVYPRTGQTLTGKAPAMAAAAAPVLQKYGWSASGWLGKFGPEIGMAAVWLPAGLELAKAIRADKAASQPDKEEGNGDGHQPQQQG